MDAIAGLLDGPRARRAFLLLSTMDPPWALRIEDEAPLTLVAVLRGHAWFVPDRAEPIMLGSGMWRSFVAPITTCSATTRPLRRRRPSIPTSAVPPPTARSSP